MLTSPVTLKEKFTLREKSEGGGSAPALAKDTTKREDYVGHGPIRQVLIDTQLCSNCSNRVLHDVVSHISSSGGREESRHTPKTINLSSESQDPDRLMTSVGCRGVRFTPQIRRDNQSDVPLTKEIKPEFPAKSVLTNQERSFRDTVVSTAG